MRAVDQWRELERLLPDGWEEARLSFVVEDPASIPAAAQALAPLGPGRSGNELRFHVGSSGTTGVESLRNLLERLDRKRAWGELSLVEVRLGEHTEPQPSARLVDAWEDVLRTLPPDWSDLLCELEVGSSDFLPRAALLCAPLNPTRNPEALALRFRVTRGGYGASSAMTRRCLERLDEERVTGLLTVLNALSDVSNVATQGPVWRVAGRSV